MTGLGSVLGEVDANGSLDATRTYDVYGLDRSVTGTPTSKHAFVGNLGHTSEDETGLVYMRARYMDPVVGRFVSEDPAEDGSNWFSYVRDNPVGGVDRTGLFLDILMGLLNDASGSGRDAATSDAVERWGADKIYSAVAKYSGELLGYLMAGEIEGDYAKCGIYIKNVANKRQFVIDFVDADGLGGPHFDFQPVGKYTHLFIEGLMDGLSDG